MRNPRRSIGMALTIAIVTVNLLMLTSHAAAQTETVLYNFTTTGSAGSLPNLSVTFDNAGNLYGTTSEAVFKLIPNADGSWTPRTLHIFRGAPDGSFPSAGMILDAAGNVYGLTNGGGRGAAGTAYELVRSANGQYTEKILHHFGQNADGKSPFGALTLDAAGNLYGTTQGGGTSNTGTVFELMPSALGPWTEKVLYNFNLSGDGANPMVGVIFDNAGNLYGTTGTGGVSDGGTAYKLSPQSNGSWTETNLVSFSHGSEPDGSLTFDKSGNLYGASRTGGADGNGTVFKITP